MRHGGAGLGEMGEVVVRDHARARLAPSPDELLGYREARKMHPFVSGRALRVATLDRLIARMKTLLGVWFPSSGEVAQYCLERFPPPPRPSPAR
jgi:hypothetical protein